MCFVMLSPLTSSRVLGPYMSQIFLFRTSMPFPGCCNTRWHDDHQLIALGHIHTLSTTLCNYNCTCPRLAVKGTWYCRFNISRDMNPLTWAPTSSVSSIMLPEKNWLIERPLALRGQCLTRGGLSGFYSGQCSRILL